MDLQSQFGSDERFRMDSRFLESDSEDEEKGNYFIVQTMLKLVMSEVTQCLFFTYTGRNCTLKQIELKL